MTSNTETLDNKSSFLKLLKYAIILMKVFGFFPLESQIRLSIKNLWSYGILTILLGLHLYVITIKAIPAGFQMVSNWSVEGSTLFGLWFWFSVSLSCIIMNIQLGHRQKLQIFDKMMLNASGQNGIKQKWNKLRLHVIFSSFMWTGIAIALAGLYPFISFSEFTKTMPSINDYKNIFGECLYCRLLTSLFVIWNTACICLVVFVYWTCCECLKQEFAQINDDLGNCDLRDIVQFKSIAATHSRLLKSLIYLSDSFSLVITLSFGQIIIVSIIFLYNLLLDVYFGFRILAAFWMLSGIGHIVVLCVSADTLRRTANAASYIVNENMIQENLRQHLDTEIHQVASLLSKQASAAVGIEAHGFFVVSKEAILATYSFILTYVVILLQSPNNSLAQRATNSTTS